MKREPGNCPYRKLPRADKENSASCDLLARLSGIELHDPLCQVSEDNCEYCCGEPVVASPTTLNPGVASYLFNLTCKVIQAGGVEGCSVKSAEELQTLATRNLRWGETEKQPSRRPEFDRPCLFLGDPVPDPEGRGAPDPSCECRHEFISGPTNQTRCEACLYYDPELQTGGIVNEWAVGITTAPRRKPTLAKTLQSLSAAGWPEVTIFAEPGTRIPQAFRRQKLVRRQETLGAWPNFLLGLMELHLARPDADAYFMVQDDALFVRHARDYLESSLWPSHRTGVVSLHTPSHHVPEDDSTSGFFKRDVGWGAWGAMAFVFPNAAVRALLRHPAVVNHRNRGLGEGKCNVDSVVGHWCNLAGFDFFLHRPSLTQHIGLTTTLWSHDSLEGRRSASDFPGDGFDARELIARSTNPRCPSSPSSDSRSGA